MNPTSTFASRAARAAAGRDIAVDPLRRCVTDTEEVILDDRNGGPGAVTLVTTYFERGTMVPVAVRYDDGPVNFVPTWRHAPNAQPKPLNSGGKLGWGIRRRRRPNPSAAPQSDVIATEAFPGRA